MRVNLILILMIGLLLLVGCGKVAKETGSSIEYKEAYNDFTIINALSVVTVNAVGTVTINVFPEDNYGLLIDVSTQNISEIIMKINNKNNLSADAITCNLEYSRGEIYHHSSWNGYAYVDDSFINGGMRPIFIDNLTIEYIDENTIRILIPSLNLINTYDVVYGNGIDLELIFAYHNINYKKLDKHSISIRW